jgi:hypothetical protein
MSSQSFCNLSVHALLLARTIHPAGAGRSINGVRKGGENMITGPETGLVA